MAKYRRRNDIEYIQSFTLNEEITIKSERVTYHGMPDDIVVMRQAGIYCCLEIYSEEEFNEMFERVADDTKQDVKPRDTTDLPPSKDCPTSDESIEEECNEQIAEPAKSKDCPTSDESIEEECNEQIAEPAKSKDYPTSDESIEEECNEQIAELNNQIDADALAAMGKDNLLKQPYGD